MLSVLVVCPNPSCPGRSVQQRLGGNCEVLREEWEATWHDDPETGVVWDPNIHCPRCSQESIDPESGQLDSAEEELGTRCPSCGVVSANTKPMCPHCGLRESQWENPA